MGILKIYNCDFGMKVNGVNYDFDHVASAQVEDPENNKLVRGSNAKNKTGLVYKEGTKDPKRLTVVLVGMSTDLKAALDSAFNNQTRVDAYAVDRTDGSGKFAKNAVLCQAPQQLNLDDSPDSMNVQLVFESFDMQDVFKS